MKKTISLFALAAAIVLGAASCNKGGETIETGTANLSIEYGFKDLQVVDESRGATSDAKPTTTWTGNIKSLTLILTNSTGNIVKVLSPTPPTDAGAGTQSIASITNLTQGAYNVYLIANAATTFAPVGGTVAISPSATLSEAALMGQNISSLSFNTVGSTATLPSGITAANEQPTEIFWGVKDVTISGTTATATVELERSVSLMRVRINKDYEENGVKVNANVNFAGADAGFVLRRTAGASFKALDGAVDGTAVDFFYKEAFLNTAPATGYTGSMNLGTDFTYWNDFLILPGGAADVNTGFNIVILGTAPANYSAVNIATGAETVLTSGGPIFWVAGVNKAITKNNILELNVTLKSKGYTGTIPPPGTYGDVDIKANLKEWGNITYVDINI